MGLREDIELALAPVRAVADRLSALEKDAIDAALYEVILMALDEEDQQRKFANEALGAMMELDDAQDEIRALRGETASANHDEDAGRHPHKLDPSGGSNVRPGSGKRKIHE